MFENMSLLSSSASNANALEQLVNVAQGLNASDYASAVELIRRAIESPLIYSFGELLDIPLIASMRDHPQYGQYFNLLRLFAYGTYLDYVSGRREGKLPELSAGPLMKLRHLSIITLAGTSRVISYDTLADYLDIRNVRHLEDLIIEAFYADVIKGKLDQLNNQLQIEFAIGRDVTDEQIDAIINCLDNWCKNCDIALKTIETEIGNANVYKQTEMDLQASIDAEVNNLAKTIKMQSQDVDHLTSNSSSKERESHKRGMFKTGKHGLRNTHKTSSQQHK